MPNPDFRWPAVQPPQNSAEPSSQPQTADDNASSASEQGHVETGTDQVEDSTANVLDEVFASFDQLALPDEASAADDAASQGSYAASLDKSFDEADFAGLDAHEMEFREFETGD